MSGLPTPQKPRRIELATHVLHDEAIAANGSIKPGMLLALNSSSQVLPHATVGGYAVRRFATEEALYSNNPSSPNSVDTAYASGALVSILNCVPGNRVNALLKAGVTYAVGDQLISDGAGRLEKASAAATTTLVKQIIAEIDEFGGGVNLSATGAVDTLCSVRLL